MHPRWCVALLCAACCAQEPPPAEPTASPAPPNATAAPQVGEANTTVGVNATNTTVNVSTVEPAAAPGEASPEEAAEDVGETLQQWWVLVIIFTGLFLAFLGVLFFCFFRSARERRQREEELMRARSRSAAAPPEAYLAESGVSLDPPIAALPPGDLDVVPQAKPTTATPEGLLSDNPDDADGRLAPDDILWVRPVVAVKPGAEPCHSHFERLAMSKKVIEAYPLSDTHRTGPPITIPDRTPVSPDASVAVMSPDFVSSRRVVVKTTAMPLDADLSVTAPSPRSYMT